MQQIIPAQLNWESMPNMGEEALDGYTESDKPLFRDIRDSLLAYDALDKFGLFLVHKHFEIAEDEEMVEFVDFEKATIVVRPAHRSGLEMSEMVPTNWIFEPGVSEVQVKVAQWGFAQDLPKAEREPFSDRYAQCFREIRDHLAVAGSLERFGMFLVRNQFEFEMEENQLECTDHDHRTLTLTRQIRMSDRDNAIPTNWIFTPDEEIAVNCCECARNSGGHLGYHRQR